MWINDIWDSTQIHNLSAQNGNESYYRAYYPWYMINIEHLTNNDNGKELEDKSLLGLHYEVDSRLDKLDEESWKREMGLVS